MKAVGIIGTPGRVAGFFSNEFGKNFDEVGGNTGNLVFQYAANSLVDERKLFFSWSDDPQKINSECRVLIIPCANQLGVHTDYIARSSFLRKIDIPILALGLGAQAGSLGSGSADSLAKKISEGTRSWLQEISLRSKTIFVRGPFTESVCRNLGVENVESFGCPSNLISKDNKLGENFYKNVRSCDPRRVILNLGVYSQGKDNYQDIVQVERKLIESAGYENVGSVAQAPKDLLEYCEGGEVFDRLKHVFSVGEGKVFPRVSSFYEIDSWRHFLKGFDVSVGTRVHGAILSLQCVQPTVLITHDSRTEELSTLMQLPRVKLRSLKGMSGSVRVGDLLKGMSFDPVLYTDQRRTMARQLCQAFSELHISPSRHLVKIAEGTL
ncbi:polysaccharide pyruvyl transferase family protein [Microbulbifer sp.]|uniref:polysaccharide pyruvyl transferase family protein n=1 Tax=Microbulbifer sp. TaxID=1908541 RepID=UPI002588FEE3|nr:polysaccharide pyruvyl transferase family protein [Microbulbifer sp.]